jgi:hypothetical protein
MDGGQGQHQSHRRQQQAEETMSSTDASRRDHLNVRLDL